MRDFGKSRTIYTVRWPGVMDRLASFRLPAYYHGLSKRDHVRRRSVEIGETVRSWLKPVIDISDLPYSYPTSGTHHAIEQWLATETRQVCCLRGEYPYPRNLRKDMLVVDHVAEIPSQSVVYMSMPFSATGRYDQRYLEIANPIVLDLAYVGTTDPHLMTLRENVEQVFWSASKPFGLGNFRTGYRFSRTRIELQEQIRDTGYYNLLGMEILEAAMEAMPVFKGMEIMRDSYEAICEECGFERSDTYLIAITTGDAFRHLAREDGTIRVPMGRVLEDLHGLG